MEVDVKVGELLDILQKNREEHIKTSVGAVEGWQQQVIKECEKVLKLAKTGTLRNMNHESPFIKLLRDRPESHADDYDSAIGILGMAASDTIRLEQDEYKTYVMDEWHWKSAWSSSSSSYATSTSSI